MATSTNVGSTADVTAGNGPRQAVAAGGPAPRSVTEAEIKGYGVSVRVPLPNWAVAALGGGLVVGLMGLGAVAAWAWLKDRVTISRSELSEYAESTKHAVEPREQREETPLTFPDGTRVTVIHHTSDGCNQIVRWVPSIQRGDGLWMFGPSIAPAAQKSSRDAAGVLAALMRTPGARHDHDLKVAGFGSGPLVTEDLVGGTSGQHCLNPHPGPWNEQGQRVGPCAVQVWRYFADGCVHFQLFNPCSGTWDVWPDGSPRVHWQRCVH